jgi:uncharacterized glyoxalase superfamily protein PhnB
MTDSTPDPQPSTSTVRQLRLVVEAEDYEAAVAFYRDALGLTEQAAFEGEGDAKVLILNAGMATLEIANPAQVRMIDRVEADGHPSPKLRIAFQVDDAQQVTDDLVDAGATLIASPRETPWRSLNARLDAPAGLQVTVFKSWTPWTSGRPAQGSRNRSRRPRGRGSRW